MTEYRVIGLMSGTSLDGLDIALCSLRWDQGRWSYTIRAAVTIPYTDEWKQRLRAARGLSGLDLAQLDTDLGRYFGEQVRAFVQDTGESAELIASHGHTVFHQPEKGLTLQIGRGAHLAAASGIPVVCDFRTTDVAHGGQGAPLVPIGDRLLFGEHDFCLNIGGIANISYELHGERLAFDICPANMALNLLSNQIDLPFDEDGQVAREGMVHRPLLERLDALAFYHQLPPKSLGQEWFEREALPLLRASGLSFRDLLSTWTEHCAIQVGRAVEGWSGTMLVTGGGARNTYLIERIRTHCPTEVILPDAETIDFKEALCFALLGVLYVRGEKNALATVTGADRDTIGGCLYHP